MYGLNCAPSSGRATESRPYNLTICLESCEIRDENGLTIAFEIEPFRRECLLKGLDDIALTLEHVDKIAAYEQNAGMFAPA